MTIKELRQRLIAVLSLDNQENPKNEVETIITEVLNVSRAELLSQPNRPVSRNDQKRLENIVARRVAGEPLQYLLGSQVFSGVTLKVDRRALIPRPETEQLIELTLGRLAARPSPKKILDLGTGAGGIAISLKQAFPSAEVLACDICPEALALAQENAERYRLDIRWVESDLFTNLKTEFFDLIVANLPYVPTRERRLISREILEHEPLKAVFSGRDGLSHYRRFFKAVGQHLSPDGYLALEIWFDQGEKIKLLAKKSLSHFETIIERDLAGFDRFALISRRN